MLLGSEPAWQTCLSEVRNFLDVGLQDPVASSPAPSTDGYPDRLTPREVEVIRLVANGKSNQEIAQQLVISFNTVTNHMKNILGKTACANRTEAAAYAFRHGLN